MVGVVVWNSFFYRKRSTDYLSQLPDDVLRSILGYLTVRDAARTTILSTSKLLEFSLEVLSQASSLKHLRMHHCIVLSSPKVRFNSLTTLLLGAVVLTSGHLEGILSSCSNLHELTIEYCKLPYKLRIAGTVKVVAILECDGVKEIDLHAAYLQRIECNMNNKVKSLTLKVQVKHLPIEIPTEMKTFRNIRNLSLILVARHAISQILELSALWSACPRLQNFSLVVSYQCSDLQFDERKRNPIQQKLHGQAISNNAVVIIQ
ncbi:hypothetical protein P3S67_027212 [Capsicum chacoense]